MKRFLLIFAVFAVCCGLSVSVSSCNVTRVVTTSSEYFQRGDTSCMIQTKTVETYDATKH